MTDATGAALKLRLWEGGQVQLLGNGGKNPYFWFQLRMVYRDNRNKRTEAIK
jgi:hypothetical protein